MTIDDALHDVEALLDAEAELERREVGADDDYSWLPDWMLKQQAALDAQEQRARDQLQIRLDQIQRRRRAMYERWSDKCQQEIDRQLAATPAKSLELSMGKAGYRKIPESTAIVIDDETRAVNSAFLSCPDAVKTSISKSKIRKYLDSGGSCDGLHIETTPEHEVFFIGTHRKEL